MNYTAAPFKKSSLLGFLNSQSSCEMAGSTFIVTILSNARDRHRILIVNQPFGARQKHPSGAQSLLQEICPILHHHGAGLQVLGMVVRAANFIPLKVCELHLNMWTRIAGLMQDRRRHSAKAMAGHSWRSLLSGPGLLDGQIGQLIHFHDLCLFQKYIGTTEYMPICVSANVVLAGNAWKGLECKLLI